MRIVLYKTSYLAVMPASTTFESGMNEKEYIAKLEAMNKEVVSDSPFNLLVTGKTFAYVCDRYEGQKVGSIQLRGKKEETVVYAILGEKH